MNYYDMSISELKNIRDKKLTEYSVKRMYYNYLSEEGMYIKDKKLMKEYGEKMEKFKDELYALDDLIEGLNDLIREKENK